MTNKIDIITASLNYLSISLNIMIYEKVSADVNDLGIALDSNGIKDIENGGFWIWDYTNDQVYYSSKFCESLGYSLGELGTGFGGFDRGKEIEMEKGMSMINELVNQKSISPFVNYITFKRKDNATIEVMCSGSVFYKDYNAKYILGTHKIIK